MTHHTAEIIRTRFSITGITECGLEIRANTDGDWRAKATGYPVDSSEKWSPVTCLACLNKRIIPDTDVKPPAPDSPRKALKHFAMHGRR